MPSGITIRIEIAIGLACLGFCAPPAARELNELTQIQRQLQLATVICVHIIKTCHLQTYRESHTQYTKLSRVVVVYEQIISVGLFIFLFVLINCKQISKLKYSSITWVNISSEFSWISALLPLQSSSVQVANKQKKRLRILSASYSK